MSAPKGGVDASTMPLLEHLRELRTVVVRAGIGLLFGVIVALLFAEQIYAFMVAPMQTALAEREAGAGAMTILGPLEGVYTYMRIGLYGGIVIASPVIFYQIWSFVSPGLLEKEKRIVGPLVFASTGLMLLGGAFGYTVIFRFGFPFFLSVLSEGTEANISMSSYLATSVRLLLGFGVCFQLPVVVFFLARMGLVNARDMIEKFRYAIVVIFIVSAIITPPDPMTQSLMAAPLSLLYAISIGVAKVFSTKGEAEEEEPEESQSPSKAGG